MLISDDSQDPTLSSKSLPADLFPLHALSPDDIVHIVDTAPGGGDNIQAMYELTPFQEGLLFHHILAPRSDPYLLSNQRVFADRAALDHYLAAMRRVVARHDILRSVFYSEPLSKPLQVVLNAVEPVILEWSHDTNQGSIGEFLAQRLKDHCTPMQLDQAPLIRWAAAKDTVSGQWYLSSLWHHLIDDRYSQDLFDWEMRMILSGRSAELEPARGFQAFVTHTRQEAENAQHRKFFQAMLGDIDAPTLPFGSTPLHLQNAQPAHAQCMVSPDVNLQLRLQARRLRVSLASLCHLAWALIVGHTSNREAVVFGTVVSGRTQLEGSLSKAMGPMINTLPLRFNLDQLGVEAGAKYIHRCLTDLLRHEQASLVMAQQCSQVQAPMPLFGALLNYRHVKKTLIDKNENIEGALCMTTQARSHYPLVMTLDDNGVELQMSAYVAPPIAAQHICDLMQQTLASLADVLQNQADRPLDQIQVMTEAERQWLLLTSNEPSRSTIEALCIHQLFEAHAAQRPEAVALVYQDQQIAYATLNARANQLAHYLINKGVKFEDRVAICAQPSIAMVVGILAVLKAGAAYVPLDPSYPLERLEFVLKDATPFLLLCDSEGQRTLSTLAGPSQRLLDHKQYTQFSESNPQPAGLCPSRLAYVIYTSGSTGTPKGVMVEHAQITRLFKATDAEFGFNDQDVWCLFHSFAFDFSVWEIWGALRYGARLIIVPREIARDTSQFYQWICQQRVSVLNQTPSAFKAFIRAEADSALEHHLRYVVFGGEALNPSILRSWYERHDEHCPRLVNMYGITETTVHVSYRPLTRSDIGLPVSPIGRRIDDLRLYILNAHGQPVTQGVIGELYVGGNGVARGYLNCPELSAQRFLPDPFSPVPQARMYRTGDLARYLPEGELEYLGRNDQQLKIRGFRIEPGEIEACVALHPSVREVVVIAQEKAQAQAQLLAYVVAQPDCLVEAAVLRAHVAASLPDYMVPAAFISLSALPLSSNGKLDRRALPAPEDSAYVRACFEAPQGEVEGVLARLWTELLGLEQVSRHDHFFNLGGHSLLAVRLLSRLPQALGVQLPLSELFAHASLAELAAAVTCRQAADAPVENTIVPLPEGSLPVLSFAQQRLWFLAQLEGTATAYHMHWGARLQGNVHIQALRASVQQVFARHAAVRSVFVSQDGLPILNLLPSDTSVVYEHDLRQSAQPQVVLQRLSAEHLKQEFNLAQGPLFRALLIRVTEHEVIVWITQHHSISDGWSLALLAQELGTLYTAFSQGKADPLPALTLQYPDYAAWQRQWLSGEHLQRQRHYWQATLAQAPVVLTLPTDRPRPERQAFTGAALPVSIDPALTEQLKQLSQAHGTTLFMTLLAAWAALLGRLAGQQEVVIGAPVANRARCEVEGLLGCFVNTLAMRIDLRGEPTTRDLLPRVRQVTLEAQAHQDLPFEQVVEAVQPSRRLEHTPLFQVLFAWQDSATTLDLPGISCTPLQAPQESAKFDLELSLGQAQGGVTGSLCYCTALFDQATVERYHGYFLTLLKAMVQTPEQVLSRIELLGEAERKHLLYDCNRTQAPYPALCVQQLFEQQVLKTPHALALRQGAQSLTYTELNAQANQLAHYLMAHAVKPEERVALCVDRSVQMVIGLLAILKTGAAYVPLDPGYPAQRLQAMLADAQPRLLLWDASGRKALGEVPASLQVLAVDTQPLAWHAQAQTNPAPAGVTPNNLAYVIYTSGSTGMPKGVMIEHDSLTNLLSALGDELQVGEGDSWLAVTTLCFDIAALELFLPLINGATVVLTLRCKSADPEALQRLIGQLKINFMQATPVTWRAMVQAGWQGTAGLKLLCGGEALPEDLAVELIQRCQTLWNVYGPTETTIWSTFARIDASVVHTGSVLIGRPLANTRVYVLDDWGNMIPSGAAGELYLAGTGVARGYWNRPELTAQRFVAEPFSFDSKDRMYRTGDLVRYLPDGNLEYLGRNDQQLKIRGFRIEPADIEAHLCTYPAVREAIVVARDDFGATQLIAYIVLKGDLPAESAELPSLLRMHLAKYLPDYMVPAAFVCLAALPLTDNGKRDRRALPVPDTKAFAADIYQAPKGRREKLLATLWQELLRVQRVGRQDQFFALGGHSLLAVTLRQQLRDRGWAIDLGTLLSASSLAAQAEALQEIALPNSRPHFNDEGRQCSPARFRFCKVPRAEIEAVLSRVPGGRTNVEDIYGLTPLQEGLLFHHLLESSDPYQLQHVQRFCDRAALDRYLAALQLVIARHPILRSAFFYEGLFEPLQVVLRNVCLKVCEFYPNVQNGPIYEQLLRRVDAIKLHICQAPLMHLETAQDVETSECWLVSLHHHLIEDRYSQDLVQEEIRLILSGQAQQLKAVHPFCNVRSIDATEDQSRQYFRDMLADIDAPTAPFGLMDVQGDGRHSLQSYCQMAPEINDRLRTQARRLQVSLASICHLAWAMVVGHTSRRDAVVFGSVLSTRLQSTSATEHTVGPLINTLPILVRLDGRHIADGITDTHKCLIQLLGHQHMSLAVAQRCSALPVGVPLFSALLNYRHHRSQRSSEGVENITSLEHSNYPCMLAVEDYGNALGMTTHQLHPFSAQGLEKMMVNVLKRLIDALEGRADISIKGILEQTWGDELPFEREAACMRAELPLERENIYEAPSGKIEIELAQIWQQLLGLNKIDRHDHFFERGGHSLLAVRLLGRAGARGWHLRLNDIYKHPIFRDLACIISARM